MFTVPQIQTFVEVALCGSFTDTAKRKGVSQGAVSTMIGKLEENLGTELFFRNGARCSLTKAGETFLPYAIAIAENTEQGRQAVDALRSQAKR